MLGGQVPCASTLSLGTAQNLEAHPQDSTPGMLFTMGFAALLLCAW